MRAIDFDLFYAQLAKRLPYFPTRKKNIRGSAWAFFNYLKNNGYIQPMENPSELEKNPRWVVAKDVIDNPE